MLHTRTFIFIRSIEQSRYMWFPLFTNQNVINSGFRDISLTRTLQQILLFYEDL
jgi:hypothetical protein